MTTKTTNYAERPFLRALVRTSATAVLGLLLSASMADHAGAVAVSPMALYIDGSSRSGSLTVFNNGAHPQEIDIGFAFGFPRSDEDGVVSVQFFESVPAGEPSALEWLRAFPRRMVLQPGERQVVRIMVQPPADLDAGEYWARVMVSARGGQLPIEQTSEQVAVQIDIETVIAVALSYRHRAVETGVEVTASQVERLGDQVVGTIDMARTGNAAYLGRIEAALLDARGQVVDREQDVLAVYHTLRRRFTFDVPDDRSGPFQVRFRLDTNREDLPPGGPLPAAPVTFTLVEGTSR